jgi:hypothetical protein
MHRPKVLPLVAALALLAGAARPASADITAFFGFTPTTTTRTARGLALGGGALFFGFEFEYSNISENTDPSSRTSAPGLKTGMGNLVLQTLPVSGFQLYGTAGGGYASESLAGVSHGYFASNFGGGVKIRLAGPLRVRVDYRVFRLTGSPLVDTYHRFYAGANLAF